MIAGSVYLTKIRWLRLDYPIFVKYNIYMAKNHHLSKSEIVEQIPLACADEMAALLLFESQRWGDTPCCVHCGDTNVYTIKDRKTGARRADGRWRCRGCGKQYTVRVGQIMEDSPIPLHKWAYAFWCAATSKNGVSALEMSRKIQVSYKSALFMMNRIRHAMAHEPGPDNKLTGEVEVDETYVGPRKPRHKNRGQIYATRGTRKQPVIAMVEKQGEVRTRVIPDVTGHTLREAMLDHVEPLANITTDEWKGYLGTKNHFSKHNTVRHRSNEYVKPDGTTTNTVEGFFSRVKRCLSGTWHAVSREHLHRYLSHTEFLYNTRELNDGERIARLIQRADGKRLAYEECVQRAG